MDCHHCKKDCKPDRPNGVQTLLRRLRGESPDLTDRAVEPLRIILVGTPNVGKSVVFHALTGSYVTVSNYPGTTVEITQGQLTLGDRTLTVIDTPGLYSLLPLTEEEQVTRDVLLSTPDALIVHVVDAKNLGRMLPLTLQLREAGFPLLLVLNMMDEATRLGLTIHSELLAQRLGIPVIPTIAASQVGIPDLKGRIADFLDSVPQHSVLQNSIPQDSVPQVPTPPRQPYFSVTLDHPLEAAIVEIESLLNSAPGRSLRSITTLSSRSLALLFLQRDPHLWQQIQGKSSLSEGIQAILTATEAQQDGSLNTTIAQARWQIAQDLSGAVMVQQQTHQHNLAEILHRLTVYPITGFPLLVLILYFGVYKFVGEFGAGTLVDTIETFFETHLNPVVNQLTVTLIPWPVLQDLIGNDYGIITLGIRYATAIVLPVVATYFLMFSLLEDSGYLPRLSLMIDRLFKSMGLSGRAVIPMVLGLGCDTMATMVTRTLETQRERLIASFLLSLAIPCAAQWGVILGLLAQKPTALLLWAGIISLIFLGVGYLTAQLLPGQSARFYMEIPPLRLPKLRNILTKTYVRMQWYFWEIIPLFIYASILIWFGRLTGLFDWLINCLKPLTLALGLPVETAPIFLYGFFRRDYGAAGLFDLQQQNLLSGNQLLISAVVLTLFLPCIAQLQILIQERGLRTTIAMVSFILPFAFFIGYLLNLVLTTLGANV